METFCIKHTKCIISVATRRRTKAVEIYKPNKKDRYLVWVELISKEVTDAQFR